MLFNSYEYILVFLPFVFLTYFYLNGKRLGAVATGFLAAASLFFYSWWNPVYLPIVLGSILFNYVAGAALSRRAHLPSRTRKSLLIIGIALNLGLLGFFKYSDFFIANLNAVSGGNVALLNLTLPLAISFFTFQQIAYLVDSHRGLTSEYGFLKYALFVTFFPQLVAGPIVHHKEMMPQFDRARNRVINYRNIAGGLFIFVIGLFKKVVIADYFASIATPGFDDAVTLTFFDAWASSLAYTFQLYFDFSGYSDMAIGAALLFNIKLPFNFNSPYRARNIQDFWRRWHITLSRFLRDYIYIPLGGNRFGSLVTQRNLMATFLLGGLWHGAGWTFVFWGFLHGAAMIAFRIWDSLGIRMHRWLAWFITFNFLNVTWVFFRANDWPDAVKVLSGMVGHNGLVFSDEFARTPWIKTLTHQYPDMFGPLMMGQTVTGMLLCAFILVLRPTNSQHLLHGFKPTLAVFLGITGMFIYTLLNMSKVSEFLYFNF